MEIRNLGKNILYRICLELAGRNQCDGIETEFVYQAFADIPRVKIKESVRWLVGHGWLREDKNRAQVHLTESGRTAIRAMVPSILQQDCIKPVDCHR